MNIHTKVTSYLSSLVLSAALFFLVVIGLCSSLQAAYYSNSGATQTYSPYTSNSIDIYVDAMTGDDESGTGSFEYPYKTISKGIDVAYCGDVVKVMPAYYDEMHGETFPIKIKNNITIQSSATYSSVPGVRRPDRPVISGGQLFTFKDPISGASKTRYVTMHAGHFSTLEGVIVETRNPSSGSKIGTGILCDETDEMVIRDVIFRGDGHEGLLFMGGTEVTVQDCEFIGEQHWGITAHGTESSYVSGCEFYTINGIDITLYSKLVVEGSELTCRSTGIRIQNWSSPTIRNNDIVGNSMCGIMINDHATPRIEENEIYRNGTAGESFDFSAGVMILHDAHPDFGKGGRGSVGHNNIMNNYEWDMVNQTENDIYALENQWTHWNAMERDTEAVDLDDIYDSVGEDSSRGEVFWWDCPFD